MPLYVLCFEKIIYPTFESISCVPFGDSRLRAITGDYGILVGGVWPGMRIIES